MTQEQPLTQAVQEEDAEPEAVRTAYKRLSLKWCACALHLDPPNAYHVAHRCLPDPRHPDKNQSQEAQGKFVSISAAYQFLLKPPRKKKKYALSIMLSAAPMLQLTARTALQGDHLRWRAHALWRGTLSALSVPRWPHKRSLGAVLRRSRRRTTQTTRPTTQMGTTRRATARLRMTRTTSTPSSSSTSCAPGCLLCCCGLASGPACGAAPAHRTWLHSCQL